MAALIKDSGVLELIENVKEIYSSVSPQVLELKRTILARAADWQRYFGFNFEAHQTPISFLTRAAKCLKVKFHVYRSGVDDRQYLYQVLTPELIDELVAEAREDLDMALAKYDDKTQGELDKIIDDKANKSRQRFIRKYGRVPEEFEDGLFNEVINLGQVDPLAVLTVKEQSRIDKLVGLRRELEVRQCLLDSVLGRYAATASIVSINGDSDIENVDVGRILENEGEQLPPDLATG